MKFQEFKNLPFPLALFDSDLGLVDSNRAFTSHFGSIENLSQLTGSPAQAQSLVLESDTGLVSASLKGIDGQAQVWHVHWRLIDGQALVLFLDSANGKDLSAFQALLDALPQAVMVLDGSGLVSAWNQSLEKLTGVKRSQVLGTTDHARAFGQEFTLADKVLSGQDDQILDSYASRGVRRAGMSEVAYEAEDDFRTPSGDYHRLLFNASPIHDDQGRTTGVVETLLDISYRHQLEQALRQSEITYRSLVDSLTEGVAIFDSSTHLLANSSYLAIFGYESRSQLEGKTFSSFIHPDSKREFLTWSRYLGAVPFEGQAVRQNGDVFRLEATINPIIYGDKEVYQVAVRDITPKKKAEQDLIEANRLEASGRLAFEIVHEINNPLNGLLTYARLLATDLEPGSSQADILEKIIKQINRCRIVVGGLHDFAGRDTGDKKSLDLNNVVTDVLDLLAGHQLLKDVALTSNLTPDLPPFRGHRTKLEQALLNVMVNAMEAMEGAGKLEISTSPASGGREILIKVKDTGRGIPAEEVPRIFEPFFSSKERVRGTGLGLSISLGIIRQHGGTIGVKTESDQGTTITFRLPGLR